MTDKELDEIFAPIQAEYDGGEPMLPGTISEVKKQLLAWRNRFCLEVIGADEPETWYNKDLMGGDRVYSDKYWQDENPKRVRNQLRHQQRNKLKEEQ